MGQTFKLIKIEEVRLIKWIIGGCFYNHEDLQKHKEKTKSDRQNQIDNIKRKKVSKKKCNAYGKSFPFIVQNFIYRF